MINNNNRLITEFYQIKSSSLKVALKKKNFSVFKENFIFEYFWLECEEILLPFSKSVVPLNKLLTFTTKSALFGYFWTGIRKS